MLEYFTDGPLYHVTKEFVKFSFVKLSVTIANINKYLVDKCKYCYPILDNILMNYNVYNYMTLLNANYEQNNDLFDDDILHKFDKINNNTESNTELNTEPNTDSNTDSNTDNVQQFKKFVDDKMKQDLNNMIAGLNIGESTTEFRNIMHNKIHNIIMNQFNTFPDNFKELDKLSEKELSELLSDYIK
jgi:hypothetical protein